MCPVAGVLRALYRGGIPFYRLTTSEGEKALFITFLF